jgi:chitin disaccharide deacetylase
VINADDFGLSEKTNKAIVDGFALGLCSSTTLMATMPGFEEACELAHSRKLLQHVGAHIVLRDGYPLTEAMKQCKRFCDQDGQLSTSMSFRDLILSYSEQRILADEIRGQIRRCRDFGIPITHVDSHHHIHNNWSILGVLLSVVRSEHIPHIRIARNIGDKLGLAKRCYKHALNKRLVAAKRAASRYFGSAEDYLFLKAKVGPANVSRFHESLEVMIHPRLNDAGAPVNFPGNQPLSVVAHSLPLCKDAVSFSGSKYA